MNCSKARRYFPRIVRVFVFNLPQGKYGEVGGRTTLLPTLEASQFTPGGCFCSQSLWRAWIETEPHQTTWLGRRHIQDIMCLWCGSLLLVRRGRIMYTKTPKTATKSKRKPDDDWNIDKRTQHVDVCFFALGSFVLWWLFTVFCVCKGWDGIEWNVAEER